MSSLLVSALLVPAKAAPGRRLACTRREERALVLKHLSALPKLAGVTPASRLKAFPTPEMVSSGIPAIDALTGGLPRGCLTEVCGPVSSGRTSVLLATLGAFTQREEVCALVDATNAFDPRSAAAGGVSFEKLLWVRCSYAERSEASQPPPQSIPGARVPRCARNDHSKTNRTFAAEERKVEQALRVTDLLLQSGGFGMVAIDLGDVPLQTARRIPLTTWFRFQRAVEKTPTVLFVIGQIPCALSSATLLVRLKSQSVISPSWSKKELSAFRPPPSEKNGTLPTHAQFFEGFHVEGELLRSRLERKPVASITTVFPTKPSWAG
jgi:hypothetical protein